VTVLFGTVTDLERRRSITLKEIKPFGLTKLKATYLVIDMSPGNLNEGDGRL